MENNMHTLTLTSDLRDSGREEKFAELQFKNIKGMTWACDTGLLSYTFSIYTTGLQFTTHS